MGDRKIEDTQLIRLDDLRESCGHTNCTDTTPYVVTSASDPKRDSVRCRCNYCNAEVVRPLTPLERRHAYQFLESLDDSRVH